MTPRRIGDLSEDQEKALDTFKIILTEKSLTSDPRYDDKYLLRFLRAREFDLEKTEEMFTKFLTWREEMGADDAIYVRRRINDNRE